MRQVPNSQSPFRETQIASAQLQAASGSTIGVEVGSDVIAVRRSLGNVLVGILGIVSDTLCVKRRAAVKLDWALQSQPAWLALDESLAMKKVVLHLRVEFKFVRRGAFACRCAGN